MKLLSAFLFAVSLFGQSQVKVSPDCVIGFSFTAAAQVKQFNNLANSSATGTACSIWKLDYSSTGFTVLSLVVEDAPDAAGVPGAWVTFDGTIVAGVNPNTSITSPLTGTALTGYRPWMRVRLASVTGSGQITGTLNGFRSTAQTAGGSSGGGGFTGFVDSSGNPISPLVCTKSVLFDTSAAGNTLLVAASGSTTVKICKFSAQDVATGNTIQLQQGTGATCAGGNAGLWMVYVKIATVAEDYNSPLLSVAGNAVCINLANATRVTGAIEYGQF